MISASFPEEDRNIVVNNLSKFSYFRNNSMIIFKKTSNKLNVFEKMVDKKKR